MDDSRVMVLELGAKGYSCAQMVMIGGLRLMGSENPGLVRAMAGLAQGVGCSGEICGALSGAVCLIAVHTGKGADQEDAIPEGPALMEGLVDWFRQTHSKDGRITCDAILGLEQDGQTCAAMNRDICGALVASCWTKAVTLLAESGIDPGREREAE